MGVGCLYLCVFQLGNMFFGNLIGLILLN